MEEERGVGPKNMVNVAIIIYRHIKIHQPLSQTKILIVGQNTCIQAL